MSTRSTRVCIYKFAAKLLSFDGVLLKRVGKTCAMRAYRFPIYYSDLLGQRRAKCDVMGANTFCFYELCFRLFVCCQKLPIDMLMLTKVSNHCEQIWSHDYLKRVGESTSTSISLLLKIDKEQNLIWATVSYISKKSSEKSLVWNKTWKEKQPCLRGPKHRTDIEQKMVNYDKSVAMNS